MNLFAEAIDLIKKFGWRKSFYRSENEKKKVFIHSYDIPCSQCGTKIRITGLTIEDALNKAFDKLSSSFPLSVGKKVGELDFAEERQKNVKHYMPLFNAKRLLAELDHSIRIREVNLKEGFLFPLYFDLIEWNDRQNQESVLALLEKAKGVK